MELSCVSHVRTRSARASPHLETADLDTPIYLGSTFREEITKDLSLISVRLSVPAQNSQHADNSMFQCTM